MTTSLRSLERWVADHPMSVPGRIAARRFGRPPADVEQYVLRAAPASTRMLICPANYAGQAHRWTTASADVLAISAGNYAVGPNPLGFAADVVVPPAVFHNSGTWQRAQAAAAAGFTHVAIESFIPPFGRLHGRDLARQVAALGDDVDVAYLCHGTDVRLPSRSRERTPLSPYASTMPTSARLEEVAARNLDVLARTEAPVFVSTPDLLQDVPRATWCPVVVDVAVWEREHRTDRDGPLRVLHAPSKASVKGSHLIEPVLQRLADTDEIDYAPARGIPHEQMPAELARTDVVVDQLGPGIYGVAACEAMAAGCVVVSHVTAAVRALVQDHTGLALPIVEAGPDSLADVVRSLARDADRRAQLVAAGRAFVNAVHSGERSARALAEGWLFR